VIEKNRGQVLMRAAQDNFSMRRKAFLIRQLAAEGYIPDDYQWCTEFAWPEGLTWVVDRSLLQLGGEARRRTHRAMHRLILAGCALWVAELALLLLQSR